MTGVSFPSAKQLKAHQKMLKEAEQFDHRIVGKEQDLFFFNDVSPGSCCRYRATHHKSTWLKAGGKVRGTRLGSESVSVC